MKLFLNMAYTENETELETCLAVYYSTNNKYLKHFIEIYVNGGCCQISIEDSQPVEKVQKELEKNIRSYLGDIYGVIRPPKGFVLDYSAFIQSYLLSPFSNEWVEDPFWKRRFLKLSPIYLKVPE